MSDLEALLAAVRAERAIELGSRGKPWDYDDVWAAYRRARHARQRAVDAWLAGATAEPEGDWIEHAVTGL